MIQQIETSAQLAYKEYHRINCNNSVLGQHLIYVYNTIQQASSQLLRITDYKSVGFAYLLMLEGEMYKHQNNEVKQVMADNAFYLLSKAIEKYPNDITSKAYRLKLYDLSRETFNELIICALEINMSPFANMASPAWMKIRDAIYKMEIVDFFDSDKKLQEFLDYDSRKPKYEKMIQGNFFGNKSINELIIEGKHNIRKCIEWKESCYAEY